MAKSRIYEQVLALRMDANEPWDPTAIAYRHGRNDVIKDVLHLLDEHRLSSETTQQAQPESVDVVARGNNGWTLDFAYLEAIRAKAMVGEDEAAPSLETVEGILIAAGVRPALDVVALRERIAAWRGDTTKAYSTRNQCADEIDALLEAKA